MLKSVTIKNFKSIQSATIKLTDLSVFIGDNGSGKSSVIEALHLFQDILVYGVFTAFNRRFGFENIRNATLKKMTGRKLFENDIEIILKGEIDKICFKYKVGFNMTPNDHLVIITQESLKQENKTLFRKKISKTNNQFQTSLQLMEDTNDFSDIFRNYILSWQFLSLEPNQMKLPIKCKYDSEHVRLESSGENLADFFRRLRDKSALSNLVIDKLRYVLPDLKYIGVKYSVIDQRQIYLYMKSENNQCIPSWCFSSGLVRILAILSILNSETPPPIVFIEEVENGLDPRTLNFLVAEIREMLSEHQFVVTSHSPYFLDLVDLRHIVVANRKEGKTSFYRPDDDKSLDDWKKEFSVGDLYTMGRLTK
jgi:predicted ATPase